MKAINLTGVHKNFDRVKALDEFDLTVEAGDIYALIGHNGAGKTTTLRLILGLFKADEGEIQVFGKNPLNAGDTIRQACGVLSESVGLYESLTVYDNLQFYAELYGMKPVDYNREIDKMLDYFEIGDKKFLPVKGFSTGMKKKVAIIRALLHKPKLVLLDEPTSGLDPVSTEKLHKLIVELATNNNSTFVITTHNLDMVEKVCNKITIVKHGKNVYTDSTSQLRANKKDLLSLYLEVEGRHL